jgi:hypothetical protein
VRIGRPSVRRRGAGIVVRAVLTADERARAVVRLMARGRPAASRRVVLAAGRPRVLTLRLAARGAPGLALRVRAVDDAGNARSLARALRPPA